MLYSEETKQVNLNTGNQNVNSPFYSVLCYNINGYEVLHEVEEKSPNAEYIYVTDDRSITSSTWEVVYVDNPHPEDPFYLCYDIRFSPFKYVHTDIVLRIDGSMIIKGNLDTIIDMFNKDNYDICLEVHPTRNTVYDEYVAWCGSRNYPVTQANKCLSFLAMCEGYDVKGYKGLYQYNFMIQRKNKVNMDINSLTLSFLKYLAEDGKQIERVDQIIGSFVINKYFNYIKVLPVSQMICTDGKYFSWCAHGTDKPFEDNYNYNQPYLFNKPINTIYIP